MTGPVEPMSSHRHIYRVVTKGVLYLVSQLCPGQLQPAYTSLEGRMSLLRSQLPEIPSRLDRVDSTVAAAVVWAKQNLVVPGPEKLYVAAVMADVFYREHGIAIDLSFLRPFLGQPHVDGIEAEERELVSLLRSDRTVPDLWVCTMLDGVQDRSRQMCPCGVAPN
jgi:hypothetical protein